MYYSAYLLYLTCSLVIYYQIKKSYPLLVLYKNIAPIQNKMKLLTYNVQRLPFLVFRPCVDIPNMLNKYDIICLQENFTQIFREYKSHNVNCVIPSSSIYKMVSSGLAIYSKYPINYIKFVGFKNLTSVDKYVNKGFVIVEINGIVIVNTHLQATYTFKNSNFNNSNEQLKTILDEVIEYDKVLICGDLNFNLNDFEIDEPYKIICPPTPTHWAKMKSCFDIDSPVYKTGHFPFFFDGGFYKNITIENINTEMDDKYTDHQGVSFDIMS